MRFDDDDDDDEHHRAGGAEHRTAETSGLVIDNEHGQRHAKLQLTSPSTFDTLYTITTQTIYSTTDKALNSSTRKRKR